MAWKKGKQGFRFEHSSQELNNSLKKIEGTIKEEEAKYLLYKFLRNNIAFTFGSQAISLSGDGN
jgi:hypothetical protein